MITSKACFIYVTVADISEGEKIGTLLIERRLAACINIFPEMKSIYRWNGEIEQSKEAVLIIKTRKSLASKATKLIKETHSYNVPCIAVLPVKKINAPFLEFILTETKQ